MIFFFKSYKLLQNWIMNTEDEFNWFKKIRKVDAPAFLYTRIRSQLDNLSNARPSRRWILAFAAAAVLIVTLNTAALLSVPSNFENAGATELVQTMQLSTNNNIYHD